MDEGRRKVLVEEKMVRQAHHKELPKLLFVAGSDRSYIDTQIAELKIFF